MSEIHLLQGDCLEILPTLADMSVDAIITDLPYESLTYGWDSVIPLAPMWKQVERILTNIGTFVTTASNPFSAALIISNPELFKYSYAWRKSLGSNFMHAKNAPIKKHEDVLVFSKGSINHPTVSSTRMTYNPQMTKGNPYKKSRNPDVDFNWNNQLRPSTNKPYTAVNEGTRYPTSILEFSNGNNHNDGHPTQKPVALYEYLIKTYTNPGDTVLDFCAGSGTTGVAAVKTGRSFIGIERERPYFETMERRITDAQLQMAMPL
jgi:site-specific DNA-methyltransferase (adenine-specific)